MGKHTTVTNIAFDTRVIEFFRSVAILETDRSRGLINRSRYIYIYILASILLSTGELLRESFNSRLFRLLMSDLAN